MKTERITSTSLWTGKYVPYFVCLLVAGMLYSCNLDKQPLSVEPEAEAFSDEFNIEVKYLESYDQTEITFTRHWPSSVAASIGREKTAGKQEGQGELMIDYEVTRQAVAFDEDGYMSSYSEFIEGDGEMNMPESLYEELKDEIPARDENHDPVIRTEFKDGIERSISKSGKVLYEYAHDPEDFRVDPAVLDSLHAEQSDTSDVDQSIQRNIQQLETEGISFDRIENYFALYNEEASPAEQSRGIQEYKIILDLRNGREVWSASLFSNGRYDLVALSNYRTIDGATVLANQETWKYGDVNGSWEVAYHTITNRTNFNIVRK